MIRLQALWNADAVIVENAGSGTSLWQELRTSGPFLPVMIKPKGSKEERFSGCMAEVEAGNLLIPDDAPWLDAFRSELKAFPDGRHDDQADSFSQFVGYQLRKWNWLLTEYDSKGRAISKVRYRKRPW